MSFAWRGSLIDGDPIRALAGRRGLQPVRGRPGEYRPAQQPLEGATIGYYPQGGDDTPKVGTSKRETGMLYVEARAAVLADGTKESHRLVGGGELVDALRAATELLEDAAGGKLRLDPNYCELRRLDAVTELQHPGDGERGLDELAVLAALDPPRMKVEVVRHRRRLETVYFRHEQGFAVHLRAYDKGVQSERAEPGEWIRVEQQNRPKVGRRDSVGTLGARAGELGHLFGQTLQGYRRAGMVAVGSVEWSERRVLELAETGRLTRRVAERMLGTVAAQRLGVGEEWWSEKTAQRRRRELREAGIVVVPTIGKRQPREIDLGGMVRELRAPWEGRDRRLRVA